jgi:nitrite reductase (NO-forming)
MRRLALVLLLSTGLVAACSGSARPAWTYGPAPSPGAEVASVSSPPEASDEVPATGGSTIAIEAFDLGFTPATAAVDAPGRYTVELTNTGAAPHDVTFPDGTQVAAGPGETASVEVDIPATGLPFICSIPGHEQGGMTGTITVAGGEAVAETPTASHDDHGGPAPTTDVAADPNAPPPVAHDPAAPDRLEGEIHDIDLVMTEQEMTVAPGFVQKVWTFGGTVPGPVIRVKVGDTIRVHLKNPAENQLAHSIDFHSSQVAWNDEMRSIAPGEELVYEWTADYAGVWMYHCGTSPALHHIANGMFGMVIVEPRQGLPPVDQEFAIVQSEWYLGPQREVVDLTKAMAAAPAPDYVVFNGVANQYQDAPLQMATGSRTRIFVLDAGPSIDSSFHIVGTIFDTVIKEGVTLAQGNDGDWGSQAVDLAPAQGAIVEFTTAEDGLYPMVTHAFNFVGRGALGIVKSGDGEPGN